MRDIILFSSFEIRKRHFAHRRTCNKFDVSISLHTHAHTFFFYSVGHRKLHQALGGHEVQLNTISRSMAVAFVTVTTWSARIQMNLLPFAASLNSETLDYM